MIKLLEENMEEKLYDTGFGIDFSDVTLKAQAKKKKMGRLGYSKMKTFVNQRILSAE